MILTIQNIYLILLHIFPFFFFFGNACLLKPFSNSVEAELEHAVCLTSNKNKMINANRVNTGGSLSHFPCIWFRLINTGTKDSIFLSSFHVCDFTLLNEIWVSWSKSAKTQLGLDPLNFLLPRFLPDGFSCRQFNFNSVWRARRIFLSPGQSLKDNYTVSCYHRPWEREDN